ncbi:hypothetical protein [Nocardia tengchongensis]|uniref:hypothetical protein n=1 Tax=Nocardia tengchongensis TaxID=2055889 RepID=UPI0033ED69AC
MSTGNSGDEANDPRARWRKLPPEPTQWIEEVDREHSAVDFGPDPDPDAKATLYGGTSGP